MAPPPAIAKHADVNAAPDSSNPDPKIATAMGPAKIAAIAAAIAVTARMEMLV